MASIHSAVLDLKRLDLLANGHSTIHRLDAFGARSAWYSRTRTTSGLDPFARRQLMALLREFRHTKIFTSHDLDMVLELCERTIVLQAGVVRADGPTREIFTNDALLTEGCLEKPFSMQNCPACGGRKLRA
jgi:hypothetical protein